MTDVSIFIVSVIWCVFSVYQKNWFAAAGFLLSALQTMRHIVKG